MTIEHPALMVTGASGNLGQHVLNALLESGTGANRIIAGTRTPEKIHSWVDKGVDVRQLDFDSQASVATAFRGVDRLLLISTNLEAGAGARTSQQSRAIEAAVAAGIKHIVYTSITRPEPGAILSIAPDDYATEQLIVRSGVGFTILRNNCYMEFLALSLPNVMADRAFYAADRGGAMGYVTRADCGRAAAAALANPAFDNAYYNINGPGLLTLEDVGALITEATAVPIRVVQLEPDEMCTRLKASRVPPHLADFLVELHSATARGHFAVASRDYEYLTARTPTSVREFLMTHAAKFASADVKIT